MESSQTMNGRAVNGLTPQTIENENEAETLIRDETRRDEFLTASPIRHHMVKQRRVTDRLFTMYAILTRSYRSRI